MPTSRYKCPLCSNGFVRYLSVLSHIKRDHRFEPYYIKCGIDGCPAGYANVEGLRSHIRRKHKQESFEISTDQIMDSSDGMVSTDETMTHMATPNADSQMSAKEATKKASARFILKAREVHRLPQMTINEMIRYVNQLYGYVMHQYQQETRTVLEAAGVDVSSCDIYQQLDKEALPDPFKELETEYAQKQYFREEFGLIVCL